MEEGREGGESVCLFMYKERVCVCVRVSMLQHVLKRFSYLI